MDKPSNPLFAPSISLLVKMGSVAVHADEYLSADGHDFDRIALQSLLKDPEIVGWLEGMRSMAMIPEKRNAERERNSEDD